MRKAILFAGMVLLLLPTSGGAQSAFDGTWKMDLSSTFSSTKPDVFVLLDGMYECKTCNPPYKVKADGADQAISGNPYIDTVAIKVVNDHEIQETDKKGGRVVGTLKSIISPDGKTVTFEFTDSSNTNGGPPVTGNGQETKVADGPAGSHAVSGSWKLSKFENLSENTDWTYAVKGDQITMTNPTGQSYTAKLDGTEAPMKGDPGPFHRTAKLQSSSTKTSCRIVRTRPWRSSSDGNAALSY